MHPLLMRQLTQAGLNADRAPTNIDVWQTFLNNLSQNLVAINLQAQEELSIVQAERDRLRSVLTSLNDGLCVFNRDGDLIFVNPAARQYLGLKEGTLDSSTLLESFRIHDQWQPDYFLTTNALQEAMREGAQLRDSDAALVRPDETLMSVACTLNPIIKGAHVTGMLLVFRDISEQKAISNALLISKESAEKASAAKSDFLSSMSHELRTPMNAILGYGEILQEDLSNPPSPDIDSEYLYDLKGYTHNILEAGKNLLELINEVLDLTRIESGKIELHLTRADMVMVIKDCLQSIEPELKNKHLHLEILALPNTPLLVLADQNRVMQIAKQVISNAIKHNRESGSIKVSLTQPSVDWVRLTIQDTGVGMTLEQQKHLYKPFNRMSGRNLSKGTGIGLTITKRLLEIMGGQIIVQSEVGVGSTFIVDLPTGETVFDVNTIAKQASMRKFLLLYIEDSATNVSLMSNILRERPDIAFISAPSGEMGLELARAHLPDVILLDINLPGINGFEVLKRLRIANVTQNIPVLGLSADDTIEVLEQAKSAGFYQYMVKPLQKKQLLQTLQIILPQD
jgi:PAS domain S-box-containing protein